MTTIALLGDVHSNFFSLEDDILKINALKNKPDMIIQLGDFNFYPHLPEGQRFLDQVENLCTELNLTLHFIDGNHDNHEVLKELSDNYTRAVSVRDHIVYLPRGYVIEKGDKRILCMGGATSVDQEYLIEGHDWWTSEEPTYRQINDIIYTEDEFDIILAHERPVVGSPAGNAMYIPAETLVRAHETQRRLQSLVQYCMKDKSPSFYFHGHHHHAYAIMLNHTCIVGLNKDDRPMRVALLDLDDMSWRYMY